MNLVLAAHSAPDLAAVAADLGRTGAAVLAVPMDVSIQSEQEALIAAALEAFSSVDVLVNNAAQIAVVAYHQLTPDQIEQLIQ